MTPLENRELLKSIRVSWSTPLPGVDVERFDLAHPAITEAWVVSLLNGDERARAARIKDAEARRRTAASRALLRACLGDMIGLPPERLAFAPGPHGKPALADAHAPFSVSHTGDVFVLAASNVREVGVDVEALGAGRDGAAVARRFFSDAERAALGDPVGERAFLRLWTAKEAVLKALGVGLQRPMGEVALSASALATLHEDSWRPESASMDGATFELFDVSQDGDAACLAVRSSD